MPKKPIAKFSVPYLQILDEHGKVDAKLEPDLGQERAVEMYRWMRLARELDERMLKLQRQGRLGTFPPCTGQEAVSVPTAMLMRPGDWFVGAFRELGGRLVRGEPLTATLDYYNGWEEGNVLPDKDLRILPTSVVIGCQIEHAAGLAYASRYKGTDEVAVAFIGDGGTSEGGFHEGLNFAAVWQAPMVTICQNNQWAISIPRAEQTHSETLAQKGIAYGMPVLQIDGNDPLAVWVAVEEAIGRARTGGGPTFIEAVTYRLLMHTTADDPKKYRTPEDEKCAWDKEPLLRTRKWLTGKGWWDDAAEEALLAEVKARVEAAVKEFEAPKDRAQDEPFRHVYGTRHAVIDEQHRDFLANIAREAEHG
ncbi:MAG: pyruvate dehydrogenase (acetyl-transferring) E1 component subunit alpha [Krumholzibacteria bacterium]|nr:pyruvate dehydrogenase (acetyl-transferring) E1 component subunit alpha [Candidatus Krumholzibacteria bacterium]